MQNRKRDTDVQNRLWDSVGEGEGGMFWKNSVETSILSRVKQITSPGWMHETSAQGWCIGKTQWDGMEREVGVGIRKENTCKSMADSCQYMAKTTWGMKMEPLNKLLWNNLKKKFQPQVHSLPSFHLRWVGHEWQGQNMGVSWRGKALETHGLWKMGGIW